MWKQHEAYKPAFAARQDTSAISEGSSGSDDRTEYDLPRTRSESLSTHASRDSLQVATGAGLTPPDSPQTASTKLPRGYELCPSCIESHGVEHSKQAARDARRLGRRVRGGPLRHTFREKIWGTGGWQDVGELTPMQNRHSSCQNTMTRQSVPYVTRAPVLIVTNAYRARDSIFVKHVGEVLSSTDTRLSQSRRYTPGTCLFIAA